MLLFGRQFGKTYSYVHISGESGISLINMYPLANTDKKVTCTRMYTAALFKTGKIMGFLGGPGVKNPPANAVTWVQSLGQEDSTCLRAMKRSPCNERKSTSSNQDSAQPKINKMFFFKAVKIGGKIKFSLMEIDSVVLHP